jgi:enoyl-CoA hydratase/carnithine racemase
MSVLLDKRADGVAIITLNRPAVLNALDVPAKERLGEIWREVADDRRVRVCILTGAGAKAFCAGSDIKEINRTGSMVRTDTLMRAIPGVGIPLSKPVVGALHGYCIGMGMTLALHCDLRLAAKNTVLGYPEVKHGMISAVSALRLPQVIPSACAMEMLLLGRNVSADEALRLGLLNAVVDDVQAEAERWAATIAGYPSSAVQATKRLAMFPRHLSPAERAEIEGMRGFVESQEHYRKGAASFVGRVQERAPGDGADGQPAPQREADPAGS